MSSLLYDIGNGGWTVNMWIYNTRYKYKSVRTVWTLNQGQDLSHVYTINECIAHVAYIYTSYIWSYRYSYEHTYTPPGAISEIITVFLCICAHNTSGTRHRNRSTVEPSSVEFVRYGTASNNVDSIQVNRYIVTRIAVVNYRYQVLVPGWSTRSRNLRWSTCCGLRGRKSQVATRHIWPLVSPLHIVV